MRKFPIVFEATGEAKTHDHHWITRAKDDFHVCVPKELGGKNEAKFVPEDFYALAMINCYIGTFQFGAEQSKLIYDTISVSLKLHLDTDESGEPWMSDAYFDVTLNGVTDEEKANYLLDKLSKKCYNLNSMKTRKHFTFHVIK